MKICPNCHHANESDNQFCEECGESIAGVPETPETPETSEEPTRFCENCGAENLASAKFCEKCGQALPPLNSENNSEVKVVVQNSAEPTSQSQSTQSASSQPSTPQTPQAPQAPRKPLSKTTKIILAAIAVVVIALFAGYQVGKQQFTRAKQVDAFTAAIAQNKAGAVQDFLITDDDNLSIDKKNTAAFLKYFKENSSELTTLKSNLKNNSSYLGVEFVKKGKKFLIFDEYKAEVTPVYGSVNTNYEGVEIKIDDLAKITADSNEFYAEVGPLLPGIYQVTATGEDAQGEEMKIDQSVVFSPNEDNSVDLNFEIVEFAVTSNVEDADLYLNDEKYTTLVDGEAEVGPINYQPGMTIQLKKTLDTGEITSEEVDVEEIDSNYYDTDYPYEIDFEILDIDDLDSGLADFYYGFSDSVNEYNTYNPKEFADEFYEDGDANETFTGINDYINNCRDRAAKDEYSGVYFETEVKSMELIGEDEYQINYYVEYHTSYPYAINPETRVEGFDYSNVKVKAFYDEDEWETSFKFVDMGDGGVKSFDNQPDAG